jgi:hypothetical protein
MGYPVQRWPWQPVEDLLTRRLGEPIVVGDTTAASRIRREGATAGLIAEVLGCHARQVWEWRHRGSLTTLWADRAAVALGLHPALIWDGWYSEGAA